MDAEQKLIAAIERVKQQGFDLAHDKIGPNGKNLRRGFPFLSMWAHVASDLDRTAEYLQRRKRRAK